MLSGLNAGNQGALPRAETTTCRRFNAVRLERRKSGSRGGRGDGTPHGGFNAVRLERRKSGTAKERQEVSDGWASMLSGLNAGNQEPSRSWRCPTTTSASMLSGLNAGNQVLQVGGMLLDGYSASMLSGLNAGNQGGAGALAGQWPSRFNAVRLERRKSGADGTPAALAVDLASMLSGLNAGNQAPTHGARWPRRRCFNAVRLERRKSGHKRTDPGPTNRICFNAVRLERRKSGWLLASAATISVIASMLSGLNAGNQGDPGGRPRARAELQCCPA